MSPDAPVVTPAAPGSSGSGRDAVLGGIRRALRRGALDPSALPPVPGPGPRPAFAGPVVDRFVAKMVEKAATVERLGSEAEVGPAVLRFLRTLPADVQPADGVHRLRVAAPLAALAWPPGVVAETGAARRSDATSVTPVFAAVAESGGIVTLSGAATPSTLNFVPDNHIVVVRAAQVVASMEDLWARWRATGQPMPRTVNIISGPSRTADIEQTIQLGAHGPRRLHILMLD